MDVCDIFIGNQRSGRNPLKPVVFFSACSIAGNPLICAAEQDCDSTKLKPMLDSYIAGEQ